MSWVLYKFVGLFLELRVTEKEEQIGLDKALHEEESLPLKRIWPNLNFSAE